MSVDTKCESCIFIRENLGCAIGLIDKYRAQGAVIEEENGCAVIKERGCLYHRRLDWMDKQEEGVCLVDIVRSEIELDATAIILLTRDDTNKGDLLEQMDKTVQTLLSMELKPVKFIFVDCATGIALKDILTFLNAQNYLVPWRLEMSSSTNPFRCVDIAVKKSKTRWFITYKAGFVPEYDLLSVVDKILHDDLQQVLLFKEMNPDDINGLLCMRIMYNQIGGNKDDIVQAKVRRVCEEQGLPHMIRTIVDGEVQLCQPSE